jgi:fatty acid desaturase
MYTLLYNVIGLDLLLFNFTVSHTFTGSHNVNEIDWIANCSYHTVNIHPHWFTNWWMGYLNFQIEHHLFPNMPQYRHVEVSKYVKEMFMKHNIPYYQMGYFEAVDKVTENLKKVAQV